MKRIRHSITALLRRLVDVGAGPMTSRIVRSVQREAWAAQALSPLGDTSRFYVPWALPALSPRSIVTVLNDIVLHRRSLILECGSGVSTIFIARLLAQRQGHLVSIEHSRRWIDTVEETLRLENIQDNVTMIHAPLVASEEAPGYTWYDPTQIRSALHEKKIDLLLVDGPAPPDDAPDARYPALPFFRPFLGDSWTIILDDARRRGEREVIQRWQEELEREFIVMGDIAIANSGSTIKFWL